MIQILINAGGTIHSSTRLPRAQKINSDLKRGFKIAHLNLVSKRQLVYHGSLWSHSDQSLLPSSIPRRHRALNLSVHTSKSTTTLPQYTRFSTSQTCAPSDGPSTEDAVTKTCHICTCHLNKKAQDSRAHKCPKYRVLKKRIVRELCDDCPPNMHTPCRRNFLCFSY